MPKFYRNRRSKGFTPEYSPAFPVHIGVDVSEEVAHKLNALRAKKELKMAPFLRIILIDYLEKEQHA